MRVIRMAGGQTELL